MKWHVIVTNLATIGEIWNGLRKRLKQSLILKIVSKLYLRLKTAIYSMIQRHIKELKLSALSSQSNNVSVTQLISLLCGDIYAIKLHWYAKKSWLIDASNFLIEEFSQFMNGSDFDKTVIASKQIFQKQANLKAVELELYLWKISQIWGLKEPSIAMMQRFGLNPNLHNFETTYKSWIDKQIRDITNSQNFLNKDKGSESKSIDYADFITDLLITINDNHFIDKSTITALDFYKMYAKFKSKQQADGRLRNR